MLCVHPTPLEPASCQFEDELRCLWKLKTTSLTTENLAKGLVIVVGEGKELSPEACDVVAVCEASTRCRREPAAVVLSVCHIRATEIRRPFFFFFFSWFSFLSLRIFHVVSLDGLGPDLLRVPSWMTEQRICTSGCGFECVFVCLLLVVPCIHVRSRTEAEKSRSNLVAYHPRSRQ